MLKKLEMHSEYLLRLEPAIVNPPFSLAKFKKEFSFEHTLDAAAKQEIKANLLSDVETLQTHILRTYGGRGGRGSHRH